MSEIDGIQFRSKYTLFDELECVVDDCCGVLVVELLASKLSAIRIVGLVITV